MFGSRSSIISVLLIAALSVGVSTVALAAKKHASQDPPPASARRVGLGPMPASISATAGVVAGATIRLSILERWTSRQRPTPQT